MNKKTLEALQQTLHTEIRAIQPLTETATATQAIQRLQAVAEYSPAFLLLLAEPWLQQEETLATLLDCARIHLYARILDDALDENLQVHRLNLLRAQPLLWRSLSTLAARYPTLVEESVTLISETVAAVQADDIQRTPSHWGTKNHHLLLAPLLLSGNSTAYQECRSGLSSLIALVQAGDEWRQGVLKSDPIRNAFFTELPQRLDTCRLTPLIQNGWTSAASRIAWEGRQLLDVLHPRTAPL